MVVMVERLNNSNIAKSIIKVGDDPKPKFGDGAKVVFHFKTLTENGILIDDSKAYGKTFEILIGKKFKIECWEECIKTMKVGEVSKFTCSAESVIMYPSSSKSMREVYFKIEGDGGEGTHGHQCGLSAMEHGLGYKDLNKLQAHPAPLVFEFELLKVSEVGEYEKEVWQMNDQEMDEAVARYHKEGNEFFKRGKTQEASDKYSSAIACLKNIQVKVRPGTDDWVEIDKRQIPLLLNHAQCMLILGNNLFAVDNCSEVLSKISGKDNKKALFKRGKAYSQLLEEELAKRDFEKLLQLDSSLSKVVSKELTVLNQLLKARDKELSGNLRGMFNKF